MVSATYNLILVMRQQTSSLYFLALKAASIFKSRLHIYEYRSNRVFGLFEVILKACLLHKKWSVINLMKTLLNVYEVRIIFLRFVSLYHKTPFFSYTDPFFLSFIHRPIFFLSFSHKS